jgi:hypothetical protein
MENTPQKITKGLEIQLMNGLKESTVNDLCTSPKDKLRNQYLLLMEISSELTMPKVIGAQKFFQLKSKDKLGEKTLVKLTTLTLRYFCDSLMVKDCLQDVQLLETANEIIESFPYESPKDLMLCLKKAKKGEYGEIFNRVDQAVVFGFWKQYLEEKARFLENQHLDQKAQESSKPLVTLGHAPAAIRKELGGQLEKIRQQITGEYLAEIEQQRQEKDDLVEYVENLEASFSQQQTMSEPEFVELGEFSDSEG